MHPGNDNFIQKTDGTINKLKKTNDWSQTAMAVAQQKQQKYVDRSKDQAPRYKIRDKVWLTLENIATATENKKLDAKQAKYTIFEDIGFHNFRLNTPPGIRNVFLIDRLRATSMDFFPSQISDDNHPGPFIVNEKAPEYDVERIMKKEKNGAAATNIWSNGKLMLVLPGSQFQPWKIPLPSTNSSLKKTI